MKNIYSTLIASLVSALVCLPTTGRAADAVTNPVAGDAAAIAEGEMLFEAVCSGYCHVKAEADRDSKCANLFDCEWKNGSGSDAEMFKVVSEGVPKTEMVGFAGQLPDDMIWQILAYVRSASKCTTDAKRAAAAASEDKAAAAAHE